MAVTGVACPQGSSLRPSLTPLDTPRRTSMFLVTLQDSRRSSADSNASTTSVISAIPGDGAWVNRDGAPGDSAPRERATTSWDGTALNQSGAREEVVQMETQGADDAKDVEGAEGAQISSKQACILWGVKGGGGTCPPSLCL
jgi:hypothetical protein